MISLAECRAHLAECQAIGTDPSISIRRATAAMAVCRAWMALAGAIARYHGIVKDEA
jgi:hypothetical protein